VNDLICRSIVQSCSELRTNMLPLFSGSKVVGLIQGYTNIPGILEPPENSRRQNGNMKQITNPRYTGIRRHRAKFYLLRLPGSRNICTPDI